MYKISVIFEVIIFMYILKLQISCYYGNFNFHAGKYTFLSKYLINNNINDYTNVGETSTSKN